MVNVLTQQRQRNFTLIGGESSSDPYARDGFFPLPAQGSWYDKLVFSTISSLAPKWSILSKENKKNLGATARFQSWLLDHRRILVANSNQNIHIVSGRKRI